LPRRAAVALAVTAALTAPLASLAEEGAGGVALYEAAEFDQAEAAFAGTLADGDATAEELALAHLYLAALGLMEEGEAAAAAHVRAAVALASELPAPQGTPIRLGELVTEAQAALPPGGMTVTVQGPECVAADGEASVRAAVTGAPGDLVSSLELSCTVGETPLEPATGRGFDVELSLPAATLGDTGRVSCVAEARGASGAVLRRERFDLARCPEVESGDLGSGDDVTVVPVDGDPDDGGSELPPPPPPGVDPRIWVGVGVGVAAIVASVVGVVLAAYLTEHELGPVRLEGP